MRSWSLKSVPLAVACLCLIPSDSHAVDETALRAAVDRSVRPLMVRHGLPGMAVAVTVDGRAMFFNYGVASKESGMPVTEHTLFELGSVSKIFTATLALYAQDLGQLSLDEHPGKYAPQLKGSAIDRASLLDLGTYTAGGLPLQFPEGVAEGPAVAAYFQQWKPDAPPATQRRYSNPSIGLLGHVTALALKTGFADAVEQQLLPALGLKRTFVRVPEDAMDSYAWGYDSQDKPVRVGRGVFDAEAYGVKSTASDLIRFVQANIEPQRLGGPIRRAVEGTHMGHFQVGRMVQGLGWEQYRSPVTLQALLEGNSESIIRAPNPAKKLSPAAAAAPGTLFNKTGSTRGFGTYVLFVPDQKIGIVLLANKGYPIPARITAAHAILQQLQSNTHASVEN